jgi:hypothetical protein
MSDFQLSPQQLTVISALSTGASVTDTAAEAGVHRNTINNWRRNLTPFKHALADAQYDRALYFREKFEAQFDLAIQTLHNILVDPDASPSVRLKAALAVIQTAATPPAPKQQVPFEVRSFSAGTPVHNSAQSPAPPPPPQSKPTPPVPPQPKPVHNSAQPIHRAYPKVGRNDLCPCGSGKKFKRCCIDHPELAAAA